VKKSTLISFIFALIALIGAAAAVVAYIKSKKAAQQIREDFLADLGYEFDDCGCDCDCGCEEASCCCESCEETPVEEPAVEPDAE